MAWSWAALMPHPPILIHEVGRGREREASRSLDGAEALLNGLKALPGAGRPDVLLLLSPHQPYDAGYFFINTAPEIQGGMGRFGVPEINFSLPTPLEAATKLARHLEEAGFRLSGAKVKDLTPDHGSQVPLYFLSKIYNPLPPVILANPVGLTPEKALALGRALADFSTGSKSWALLASGDLSHRLKEGAPAGYNPEGAAFDQDIVEALKSGQAEEMIGRWPADRLKAAGECGFKSALALLGLADGPAEVLSYEGPFGVGYCNAFWKPADSPGASAGESHPYPRLARLTARKYLGGNPPDASLTKEISSDPALWSPQKACFVSIKTVSGELRGCIGTILPVRENLGEEIMANAVSAATRDPRFKPMVSDELGGVTFSVDVLSQPEPVSSLAELDPAYWGVIVEKDGRRGLLLPDLEGVDTVEAQLSIAAGKAGITDLRGLTIHRFSVTRYQEQGGGR
ncbi:AmmeMemoRadiSam system protein A [Deltaproteobacteria bacterium Smac51]|nr:AmmeMemoRadiSam system protein A [Deltaproteobacteria bacterium Smac51]